MATTNGTTTNGVPKGTAHMSESSLLDALKACKARNFDTIADVVLHGVEGGPIDDKTYLMERIIQLTADLPHDHSMSDTLTHKLMNELWNDLSHPPASYLGYDFTFRKADGSNNNIMWPHIGKAGQPYARSVKPRKMQPARPDPGVVFDALLDRGEKDENWRPHPNNISSVLFYMASIIIHDCFHTSHTDYAISETSSYLDLAPLYGSTLAQQLAMRTMENGKIKPDCFSDSRIHGFPPGVGVMLIMFNRFHNNVVENLAKIDENGRFSKLKDKEFKVRSRSGLTAKQEKDKDGKDVPRTWQQDYDEALFQTGRLVTTGLYINIVLQDYVRTILGLNRVNTLWNLDPRSDCGKTLVGDKIPEAGGNQVSAEFSLVYRWHSCVSKRDAAWTTELVEKVKAETGNPDTMRAAAQWADDLAKQLPEKRSFENLERVNGRYPDEKLVEIWKQSVDDVAGAFGAANVPRQLKFVEVLSMMQARSWNLASLNEFRAYFKLAPHKTFESINPDPRIAKQLERLYGHPDNVEIYPGIVVESGKKPMAPGSGLCASWTTSRAILSDAVALVRGDRFYTVDYTPNNLTNWGFQAASYDQDINHGGVIYKLVLNAFPNHVAKNSVYAHFPMVNPGANKDILGGMNRAQLYDFKPPWTGSAYAGIKASSELAKEVVTGSSLGTSNITSSSRLSMYGASSASKTKAEIKLSFAEAVMSNQKWKDVVTKFYTTTLDKLWQEKQYELGGYQTVDVVADVLNAAHAAFITSVLDIPISPDHEPDEPHGLLASLGHFFEHAFGANPHPQALNNANRGWTHWFANKVASAFGSNGASSDEAHLGKAAIAKMTKVNGADATQTAWQDILPTSALLLTALSRSSASAVEKAVAEPGSKKQPETDKPAGDKLVIALRATADIEEASKHQTVMVDVAASQKMDDIKLNPQLALTQQVTDIANKAILKIVENTKGIARMPGPQGQIKRIDVEGGDVRFLNENQSDYVTYPVSMKLRWKK